MWLVVSYLIMVALLSASCIPAVTEKEEVAPPVVEEEALPEEGWQNPAGLYYPTCQDRLISGHLRLHLLWRQDLSIGDTGQGK